MNLILTQILRQFMEKRLHEYHNLMDLNLEIKELIEQNKWDQVTTYLNKKNDQIAEINRLTEGLKKHLQKSFPNFKLSVEGWKQPLESLSVNDRIELEPLMRDTRALLLQMQKLESVIVEKIHVSQEELTQKVQTAKTNKKAHQAYEQYRNMSLFIDKQR